ncbi:hypothetical protein E2C01_044771 [Portunus trituberculatus]|uniref:Uncharacterized protein n=1 Tax=Portunus trituberculatus TaxID=210409 RepID=A0A5B7G029_PORTR|nr:hypothetical protein [Portunus trituberculatus]
MNPLGFRTVRMTTVHDLTSSGVYGAEDVYAERTASLTAYLTLFTASLTYPQSLPKTSSLPQHSLAQLSLPAIS